MATLANKYRPNTFDDVTEQKIVVDILKNMCSKDTINNRNFLLIGPAGTGKAQPLDSKVLTYSGYIKMGDVEVGTEVFTHTGNLAKVTDIFPQGEIDTYYIIFNDSSRICVSLDHLNIVEIYDEYESSYVEKILTTSELLKVFIGSNKKIYIPDVPDEVKYLFGDLYKSKYDRRYIKSIQYNCKTECQCIYVDNEDHTYISDFLIPTHNTTMARIIAKELNGESGGEIIEIDAASHNGVDSVKEIINQARTYPIGSKYKIFVIDECFPGNHWVNTPSGKVQIKNLSEGDRIYNMSGISTVSSFHENRVKTSNLIYLRVNGRDIITTINHPFFTDDGWVSAKDLKEGDILYDYKTMQTMWERVSSQVRIGQKSSMQQGMQTTLYEEDYDRETYKFISKNLSNMWERILYTEEYRCKDLFYELWCRMEEIESEFGEEVGATFKTLALIYLSGMWEDDGSKKQPKSEILLTGVCNDISTWYKKTENIYKVMRMVWEYIRSELKKSWEKDMFNPMQGCVNSFEESWEEISRILEEDEGEESNVSGRSNTEDDRDKRKKRDIAVACCKSWWKWSIYEATDFTLRESWGRLDFGTSCEDGGEKDESKQIPIMLQTGYCFSRFNVGDRGGWCLPQFEIQTVIRRKESELSGKSRVDYIEVYKRGYNDELFYGSFTDKELHEDFVTMYDLSVEGHPSYFVNDILVHNCHSISSQGWQIFLKALEEAPAKSVFIFCTTNPEKIPATITSRVQTFQLSKISLNGIVNRLKYVIECEVEDGVNISYEDDAINLIAKLANGGMRDALTLLDKVLVYTNDVNSSNVEMALNLPNYDDYFELLSSYAKKDNLSITDIINKIYNSGVNFVKWFEGFHSFVMNVVKYIYSKDINITTIPNHYIDKISNYGVPHIIVCLKLSNKLFQMISELKRTQYLQEVALTYLYQIPKKK